MKIDVNDPKSVSDFADFLYGELPKLTLELDTNPLEMGPSVLNEKVATARGMVNQCERFNLAISESYAQVKRSFRTLETQYRLQSMNLYANDKEVRAGRSEKERDAIIGVKLRALLEEMQQTRSVMEELETIHVVVKSVRTNLKDTEQRLKDQIQLCYQEIKTGGTWGGLNIPEGHGNMDGRFRIDNDLIRESGRNRLQTKNRLFFPVEPIDLDAEIVQHKKHEFQTATEVEPSVFTEPITESVEVEEIDPEFKNIFASL